MTSAFKLTIAYDGTGYSGWQRQKNARTIQGEIESRLAVILDSPVNLHGAGRTDAGVHARAMTAHFHTEKSRSVKSIWNGLNSLLPRAIRITGCTEVSPLFHARFDAKAKLYSYHIFTGQIQMPTARLYSSHVPFSLCSQTMTACLKQIIGTHDFSSFEAAGSRDPACTAGRGAVRTIERAELQQNGEHLTILIQGDGFLRHMVRNIAGTLIEAGRGKRSVEDFSRVLAARNRAESGSTAPACGLFLEQVFYEQGSVFTREESP
ncbi:MAG: tRNA pseudouridine(38-40) synthase TruA [Deltaproteobacteria bacterium]|nr:MAG: tRNA pseudouridine(38-40) synthase TruA [Deltaproteobacteria bacterium]